MMLHEKYAARSEIRQTRRKSSELFESQGGWRSRILREITILILVIGNIQICC